MPDMFKEATLAVVIPCHNDCKMAEDLVASFRNQTVQPEMFVIGHDRCNGYPASLNFGNKAATVNHYAKILKCDYIIILDADLVLTETFFEAIKLALRDHPLVGSGLAFGPRIKSGGGKALGERWYWNGSCMIIERKFLQEHPLPVAALMEDTMYGQYVEKKLKVKGKVVENAACYMERKNETLARMLRRDIRYMIGEIQISSKFPTSLNGIATGLFGVVCPCLLTLSAIRSPTLFVLFFLIIWLTWFIAVIAGGTGPYLGTEHSKWKRWRKVIALSMFFFVIPTVATLAWAARKRIW